MAAIAASGVTVTIERRGVEGRRRRNRVKLVFGNGVDTYSTGGIPLPAASAFGMKRNLEYLIIVDDSGSGYVWRHDKTNNKLFCYIEATVATNTPLAQASAALAPAAQTLYAEAVGW